MEDSLLAEKALKERENSELQRLHDEIMKLQKEKERLKDS
jgi:hypothetical protein